MDVFENNSLEGEDNKGKECYDCRHSRSGKNTKQNKYIMIKK